jgi:hypothetical protein
VYEIFDGGLVFTVLIVEFGEFAVGLLEKLYILIREAASGGCLVVLLGHL